MKTTLLFLSVFLTTSMFGQNVYIPDANFKAYLVGNPDINTNGDTEIQVSEASVFDGAIGCFNSNIIDLTGIEAFTSLTGLYCAFNSITSLDLNQNTALINLVCDNNQLTSLDVGQCSALFELDCEDNQLTSLDISQNNALAYVNCTDNQLTSLVIGENTALYYLWCHYNQLTSLDVSQIASLTELSCDYNQLTSLDVSQNTYLTKLYCDNNQLTSLDVSQNNALVALDCFDNQLICLNVANGNNTNMSSLWRYNNPNLTCIEVDDVNWSNDNWTIGGNGNNYQGDSQHFFSENCDYPSDCFTSSLTELTTSKNLIQILDMMGRETSFKPNTPLIYVYDDGSIEKVFSVEY